MKEPSSAFGKNIRHSYDCVAREYADQIYGELANKPFDRDVLDGFGLKPDERLAGFIHIGTPSKASDDRPRPSLSEIVTRF